MGIIYLIEDINDLRYVGSTIQLLSKRMSSHIYKTKMGINKTSSKKLNLYNCIIIKLDTYDNDDERHHKEKYYINKFNAINEYKFTGRNNKYRYSGY